ncbi:MAG: Zn-dependent hydrolase [Magnetococcales bacterium]|nr:Zn-dependent hydrolase [Magnetococcales bacterium]
MARSWRRGLPFLVWLSLLLPWCEARAFDAETALQRYVIVNLEVDLSVLSDAERQMVPLLGEAARAMESVFWRQTFGEPEALFSMPWTPAVRQLLALHFGPWDRMENNRAFLPGIAAKPEGARFYPADLTREAFETAALDQPALKNPYTLVRRDAAGALVAVPYHQAFAPYHTLAADRLRRAADLTTDEAQSRYLARRAEALLTDRYHESDRAWMEMKENRLDLIIGPIETYEDGLMGIKAAHEALLLIKDPVWERRLAQQTRRLTDYQAHLPVPENYRAETPGGESNLGVYDVVMMTGDAAATRPIAINLPNDEQVQLEKGSRRLQLRNVMRAKFERILLPMAKVLLDPGQWCHVTFEALFANTLFHEVAHGLGIKKTVRGAAVGGTVNDALKEDAWMMEEGKADALSLWLGDLDAEWEVWSASPEGMTLAEESRYVTEFASLFRAIRFGPGSAHARANLIRFNFLREAGAFVRNEQGRYHLKMERMRAAVRELSRRILMLQGDGDLEGVRALEKRYGHLSEELLADLRRVEAAGVPVDVVFQPARGL